MTTVLNKVIHMKVLAMLIAQWEWAIIIHVKIQAYFIFFKWTA